MKSKFLLSLLLVCSALWASAQQKTDTIKVWGTCEMCKAKIESAATAAGAAYADWNQKNKLLVVRYDEPTTSLLDIQKSIASSGYDTQDVKASDGAYQKLEKCCQYTRQSEDPKDTTGMNGMHEMSGKTSTGKFCGAPKSNAKKQMNCGKDCSQSASAKE